MNTHTTRGIICGICNQMYPHGTFHYCGGLPLGPPAHILRQFSEAEIRQIVRDELQRSAQQQPEKP